MCRPGTTVNCSTARRAFGLAAVFDVVIADEVQTSQFSTFVAGLTYMHVCTSAPVHSRAQYRPVKRVRCVQVRTPRCSFRCPPSLLPSFCSFRSALEHLRLSSQPEVSSCRSA
jgi:hypothetical protein